MLKEQLFQRDEIIQQLRTDLGNFQGEAYEAGRKTASIQTELNSRIEQLNESRKAADLLQVEKNALINENKEKDIQIKNLLEELKLTKEAAGDSGSQIGTLSRDLRNARESAEKLESELSELKATLETRTKNFMNEKTDLKLRLDEALASLKNKDSNSSSMAAEVTKLKDELRDVKKKLQDTE